MVPLAIGAVRTESLQIEIVAEPRVFVVQELQILFIDRERHVQSLAVLVLIDDG